MPAQHPPQTPGELEDPLFQRHLLQHLLTARAVEERCILNVKLGLQPKFFSAWGNEAGSVGTAAALQPQDVLVPMHRSLGAHLVRGHSLYEIFLQAFLRGRAQTRGRDTGIHLGAPGTNIVGMISPLGSMNVVAAGIGMAESYLGTDTVTLTYIGDGGSSTGVFHEAMNLIGVRKLPVVTVIENNQWAYGTPNEFQFACERLADRGPAYGMPGVQVDGTDLCAVYTATREAVERARRGEGPTLIESVTMRMRGHAEHDGQEYVPEGQLEEWAEKDPVRQFLDWLDKEGHLSDLDIDNLKKEIAAEVLEASDRAHEAPEPDPSLALTGVFAGDEEIQGHDNGSSVSQAPSTAEVLEMAAEAAERAHLAEAAPDLPEPGSEVTYLEAIRECMRWRMREDPRVVLLGEDVGLMGGAFKMTDGFLEEFGGSRALDMPIAEGAITGACIGLALRGLRPITEMQFADFVASTFNELVNNAGTFRYRIGAAVPFVMRLPAAGGVGAGPFHSLNPEAWFAHAPGLRVVIPSTIEDAWGLMNSAMDQDDPVLYLEQKYFYRRLKGLLPSREHRVPLGKARVAREGSDATVVTWGIGVERCTLAADRVAEAGLGQTEVLDLRSIVPWDQEAVAESVRKTSRMVVMHEARRTCGFGAEVASWASEELFDWLDAPILRVTSADVPTPSHKALEAKVTPQVEDVENALKRVLQW